MNENNLAIVKIKGGFGNQLFQIFTCISYGLEHNYNIIFPYIINIILIIYLVT